MGLYDEVKIEMPLPDDCPAWVADAALQTKDLDQALESYTITPNGILVDRNREPIIYHGDMHLYGDGIIGRTSDGDAITLDGSGKPEWVDLVVRFNNSVAQWVKLSHDYKIDEHARAEELWWML